MYKIKRIPFYKMKTYWEEVEHFHIPNKVITEKVTELGPYKSVYKPQEQRTISYGLFDKDYMIGGTQIMKWDKNTVRWRANNIREEYRGDDLFYQLLNVVIFEDWKKENYFLIGWFRSAAMWWPPKHHFLPYDGVTHKHDGDEYTMVKKYVSDMTEEYYKGYPKWNLMF